MASFLKRRVARIWRAAGTALSFRDSLPQLGSSDHPMPDCCQRRSHCRRPCRLGMRAREGCMPSWCKTAPLMPLPLPLALALAQRPTYPSAWLLWQLLHGPTARAGRRRSSRALGVQGAAAARTAGGSRRRRCVAVAAMSSYDASYDASLPSWVWRQPGCCLSCTARWFTLPSPMPPQCGPRPWR